MDTLPAPTASAQGTAQRFASGARRHLSRTACMERRDEAVARHQDLQHIAVSPHGRAVSNSTIAHLQRTRERVLSRHHWRRVRDRDRPRGTGFAGHDSLSFSACDTCRRRTSRVVGTSVLRLPPRTLATSGKLGPRPMNITASRGLAMICWGRWFFQGMICLVLRRLGDCGLEAERFQLVRSTCGLQRVLAVYSCDWLEAGM